VRKRPFTAFEVHKCAEYADPKGGTYVETIDNEDAQGFADEEALRQFWTVYGYRPHAADWKDSTTILDDGGLEEISDFESAESAIDLAEALAGSAGAEVHVY
jgi:hypothetical protein